MTVEELWCSGCSKNLPSDAFYFRKDGTAVFPCKECKVLIGARRYQEKKGEIVFNQTILDKKLAANEVILPLKANGCIDCRQVFIPEAMEFDHVRGKKRYTISSLPFSNLSAKDMLDALQEELKLCEVCCANCHRKRTVSRYGYSARREYLNNSMSERLNAKSRHAYGSLMEKGCIDCLSSDLMTLEFDHVRGIKIQHISVMLRQNKYSVDDIKEEIAKCEVRCVVCHRIKTISRQIGIESTEQEDHVGNVGRMRCDCGRLKDITATTCASCYNAKKFDSSKYPPLEEIITGVETYGWLPYSKTLGISDNGLRKVARKLGADPLPRKKR